MTTNNKHCQTFTESQKDKTPLNSLNSMYDETVAVENAAEVESPSSEEEVVKAAMSKFTPPVRHTARHDFDSESDSESDRDDFLNQLGDTGEEEVSTDLVKDRDRKPTTEKAASLPRQPSKDSEKKPLPKRRDSSNSETDSGDLLEPDRNDPLLSSGRKRGAGVVIPAEGAYDPKQYADLKVPTDIENLFQYIMKYTPQKIDIDFKLQPFVPEYVPAVGDIDAFLKVTIPPANVRAAPIAEQLLEHIDNLGLTVLDEPAAAQSDAALLHLQLRAVAKTRGSRANVVTKKIENAEKNSKAIERWIKDVSELHLSKPAPTVTYNSKMPDIDTLMEEWPESMEDTLNDVGFPPPTLDCSLAQYVDLVCAMFDIPIAGDTLNDRIQGLHLLFSLYSAVKNSQLYVERQKEKENVV